MDIQLLPMDQIKRIAISLATQDFSARHFSKKYTGFAKISATIFLSDDILATYGAPIVFAILIAAEIARIDCPKSIKYWNYIYTQWEILLPKSLAEIILRIVNNDIPPTAIDDILSKIHPIEYSDIPFEIDTLGHHEYEEED